MSSDRLFPTFDRGELREEILAYFRNGLRDLIDPETQAPFTEETIAIAVADFTRWWAEADAVDLVLLPIQSRALWMSDQILPDRASSTYLARHGAIRVGDKLPASGGGGEATGECLPGSTFVGSTDIPDASAHYALDAAGRRYQVVATETAIGNSITLTFRAIETGIGTNLTAGATLYFSRGVGPVGADEFTVEEQFNGGGPAESDQEYARRILDAMRRKQGSGNRAQLRDLGRRCDPAIGDVFLYACAYHSGSFHAAVLGRRRGVTGPNARIASAASLAIATSALTPPGTDQFPGDVHAVITADRAEATDLAIGIDLGVGGWVDAAPWPTQSGGLVQPISVTSQTEFRIAADDAPEGLPTIMLWDVATSRWETVQASAVDDEGGGEWTIHLASAPSTTIATTTAVCPAVELAAPLAEGLEAYFDSLGPGELVSDERVSRAYRYPIAGEAWPNAISTSEMALWLKDVMGVVIGQGGVTEISFSQFEPSVPTDPTLGPYRLTLGQVGVYPQ